jgi:hypothetical protein
MPTYRQLDHWCRVGYLRIDSPGSGYLRNWPATEQRVAELMGRLVDAGMRPGPAAELARTAVEQQLNQLPFGAGLVLVVQEVA